MRAVADNPDLARLKGIDPRVSAIATVFLGAGSSGIGGVLIGLDARRSTPLTGLPRPALGVCRRRCSAGRLDSRRRRRRSRSASAEELALIVVPATYRTAVGFVAILLMLTFRPLRILGERAA